MATSPTPDENPIRPDQHDVVETDLPDIGPEADPPAEPDGDQNTPEFDPDGAPGPLVGTPRPL